MFPYVWVSAEMNLFSTVLLGETFSCHVRQILLWKSMNHVEYVPDDKLCLASRIRGVDKIR